MKRASTLVSAKYLKISDCELKPFLLSMDLPSTQPVSNNDEHKQVEVFTSFQYSNRDYELFLEAGRCPVGSKWLEAPLVTKNDNIIKNILFKTLNLEHAKFGSFGEVREAELKELIYLLQNNASLEGYNYSKYQIKLSLIRLSTTSLFVRRKGLVCWHHLALPVMLLVQVTDKIYQDLGRDSYFLDPPPYITN